MDYISLALGLTATVYGFGEKNCGDIGKARPCARGAVTAAGHPFDPNLVTMAVPMPTDRIVRPQFVCILSNKNRKVYVLVNDKSHPRWIGKRGFDLSPGAWRALGYEPHKTFSARLKRCPGT